MKQAFLISIALIISPFFLFGQASDVAKTLEVQWPIGTHIQITRVEWSEELKKEKYVVEDSSEYAFEIKVVGGDDETLDIEYLIDDPIYSHFDDWNHALQDEAEKKMTLDCKINKKTGEIQLPNWEELAERTKQKYGHIQEALVSADSEMSSFFDLIFGEFIRSLQTEQGIINLYAGDLVVLLKPYGKKYQYNTPVVIETEESNPFNKKEKLKSVEKYTLLTTTDRDHYTINYDIEFDMELVIKIMREVFQKLIGAMSSNAKSAEEKQKELDAIKMEMTNKSTYIIGVSSTLPGSVDMVMEVNGFDGKMNRSTHKHVNYRIENKK
ncbi:MAG: hypothetical protein RLZZ262_1507 [Bacteroidota bacterium]